MNFPPDSDEAASGLFSSRMFAAWPWLLALLALGLGGLFLWRNRLRPSYSGGPAVDAFVAPEPPPRVPAPRPPVPQPSPASLGIVSTRIRPRIELRFTPLRCSVADDRLVVEFDLELINQGSAPARAILVEASLFNAGPAQDEAVGAFFAKPVGQGERIDSIPPLKRFAVRSQVIAPRANVQLFQVEGRDLFVPLIAFNALYRWSGGEGQTSMAFLLGRETGNPKLAPLRADLGPRQYLEVGARPLPNGVQA